jgi:GTPase Era involved in 16S rRNA processing
MIMDKRGPVLRNVPVSPVNVIAEDNINENILYLGTDNGLYVSLNRGKVGRFSNGMPNVAVHDVVIQKKARDLVVGTHGRSIYKVNVDQIEQLTDVLAENVHIFEINKIKKSKDWETVGVHTKATDPKATIWFYSNIQK